MPLFISLLPVFIFGNLHCMAMCGPLVSLLSRHPHKNQYFLGRMLVYTAAGLICSELGMLLFHFLQKLRVSAAASLLCGVSLASFGAVTFFKIKLAKSKRFSNMLAHISRILFKNISLSSPNSAFLFGAGTILLPCGQTLFVFSACALYAEPLSGLINGCLFALFTSPSLMFSMKANALLSNKKHLASSWIGISMLAVGSLSILRGLADLGMIEHWTLNPQSPERFHLVLF